MHASADSYISRIEWRLCGSKSAAITSLKVAEQVGCAKADVQEKRLEVHGPAPLPQADDCDVLLAQYHGFEENKSAVISQTELCHCSGHASTICTELVRVWRLACRNNSRSDTWR